LARRVPRFVHGGSHRASFYAAFVTRREALDQKHACMTDHDAFLTWVKTTLYEAELALHNGDAAPRRALWSRNEPVSVLGCLAQRPWPA
jgi:hypothetical protein